MIFWRTKKSKNFIEFRCNFFFFKWMKRAWNEARNAECVSARISGRSRWVFRSAKGPFWGFFWGRLLDYSELWAQTVANYRDAQQQQLHWLLLRNPRRNNFFLCLIVPFFFFRVEKKIVHRRLVLVSSLRQRIFVCLKKLLNFSRRLLCGVPVEFVILI